MNLAQRLQYLMDSGGITNYQLAKSINCHQTTIANILGGSKPQNRTKIAIADYFGVTVSYLEGETDDPAKTLSPYEKVDLKTSGNKHNFGNLKPLSGPVAIEDLPGYKGHDKKEKSPTPEGVELDSDTMELLEAWNSGDDAREFLLSAARMLKSRRDDQ